jgi:hypothetical protein
MSNLILSSGCSEIDNEQAEVSIIIIYIYSMLTEKLSRQLFVRKLQVAQ